MLRGLDQLIERKEGGDMYLLWVPLIGDVRTLMMDEAHASRLPRSSSGYDSGIGLIVDREWTKVMAHYIGIVVDKIYFRGLWSHVLWAEIGEIRSIGSELVQQITNKVILIKEKLKAARDCQKSYVGNMRKHLELKLVIK
ncbi:hypothetical protein Tco_1152571 [Tanacetum coccineum]